MSTTETVSRRYRGLDLWDDQAILAAFLKGQRRAIEAVDSASLAIAAAARAIVERVGDTGRLIYVGAGSSGVIAALDGMELAGTFGWPEQRTHFVLASGNEIKPGIAGGPEDDSARGVAEIAALALGPADVVIAVAASGTTPFTLAAAKAAREAGALTIGVASNADAPLLKEADVPVFLDTGPEIIAGSTRMDAGTAQKAALNLLSSLVMIRLGRIYDGYMVDVRADNAKLRKRAVTMLTEITGVGQDAAAGALDICDGRVKHAALVARGVCAAEAERILADAKGNLRIALARLHPAGDGHGAAGTNAGDEKASTEV